MSDRGQNRSRSGATVRVYRGPFPLWLLLLVAPLGLVFLASLAIALMIAGAGVALVLPLFLRRRSKSADPDLIELDPSDYHVVDRPDRR
jgi:hypothetical protein